MHLNTSAVFLFYVSVWSMHFTFTKKREQPHLLIVLICGLVSSSLLLRLGQLGVVGLLQCILVPAQPLLYSAQASLNKT